MDMAPGENVMTTRCHDLDLDQIDQMQRSAIDDCQNDQMVDGWWCRPSGTRLDLLSASTLDPVADRPLPRTRPNIKHSFSTFQIVKKFSWG